MCTGALKCTIWRLISYTVVVLTYADRYFTATTTTTTTDVYARVEVRYLEIDLSCHGKKFDLVRSELGTPLLLLDDKTKTLQVVNIVAVFFSPSYDTCYSLYSLCSHCRRLECFLMLFCVFFC